LIVEVLTYLMGDITIPEMAKPTVLYHHITVVEVFKSEGISPVHLDEA